MISRNNNLYVHFYYQIVLETKKSATQKLLLFPYIFSIFLKSSRILTCNNLILVSTKRQNQLFS